MDEQAISWIKLEMAKYDRLSPEMRAVVQEYGHLPYDLSMSVAEYRAGEQYMREQDQQYLFTQGV